MSDTHRVSDKDLAELIRKGRDWCTCKPEGGCFHQLAAVAFVELQSARVELERMRAANQWQPIETAPKGSVAPYVAHTERVNPPRILLLFEFGGVSIGYWDWYYAEGGSGCRDGVAWIEPCSSEQLNLHYGQPTHWMPLPPPYAAQPNEVAGS